MILASRNSIKEYKGLFLLRSLTWHFVIGMRARCCHSRLEKTWIALQRQYNSMMSYVWRHWEAHCIAILFVSSIFYYRGRQAERNVSFCTHTLLNLLLKQSVLHVSLLFFKRRKAFFRSLSLPFSTARFMICVPFLRLVETGNPEDTHWEAWNEINKNENRSSLTSCKWANSLKPCVQELRFLFIEFW